MKITVRPLAEADVEAVSRIEEESFSMPWSAAAFRDLVNQKGALYLVAEADGEVAGCCGLNVVLEEGDIGNVVVAPSMRGKGIGQAMLAELLRQGEAMGLREFTLEVRISNADAIHVYEKLGFVSEGIRPGFYDLPKEDAMIMWRR